MRIVCCVLCLCVCMYAGVCLYKRVSRRFFTHVQATTEGSYVYDGDVESLWSVLRGRICLGLCYMDAAGAEVPLNTGCNHIKGLQ